MNPINISSTNKTLSFGSKNCPVKPFAIQTQFGPLQVEELKTSDLTKAAKYSVGSSVEAYESWRTPYEKLDKKGKKSWITFVKDRYIKILNKTDGNSTILVAKNSKGKIKAIFTMQNFDEFKNNAGGFADSKTGYIEECMTSSKYRGQGIGKIMINKLIETARGNFTDIVLEGENKALAFYGREGFKPLDLSNPSIKKISDFIMKARDDSYTFTVMNKTLDPSNPWWKRIAASIK